MTTETVSPITIETDVDTSGVGIRVTHGDVELEHVIPADDLRREDWIRVDEAPDHCQHATAQPLDFGADSLQVMEEWHNGQHAGVFRVCSEEPCRALVKSMEVHW